MAGLPGWDSLESVTRWVAFYEIAMISVLAALVGAEVLHSNYSHRKDVLIKAREEQQAADTNRDKDEAEVRRGATAEAIGRCRQQSFRASDPEHCPPIDFRAKGSPRWVASTISRPKNIDLMFERCMGLR